MLKSLGCWRIWLVKILKGDVLSRTLYEEVFVYRGNQGVWRSSQDPSKQNRNKSTSRNSKLSSLLSIYCIIHCYRPDDNGGNWSLGVPNWNWSVGGFYPLRWSLCKTVPGLLLISKNYPKLRTGPHFASLENKYLLNSDQVIFSSVKSLWSG